jgi:acetylornithine/N-succinyldiaminopimelate aminotransferase
MTLAKALGGGMPVGAILSNEEVSAAMDYGDHGTTFGGNPLACRAALTTIKLIGDENLLNQAEEKGKWIKDRIERLNRTEIKEIRGKGLMLGIEFRFETPPLVGALLEKGVLANATAGNVLRMVPPLNIPYEDLEYMIEKLVEVLNEKAKNEER